MTRLWIRTYTGSNGNETSHSFYVGNDQGGLSERIASFLIHEYTTFTDIRQMIEVTCDKGMYRRSALFSEIRHVMSTSPNPHEYPQSMANKYVFGSMKGLADSNENSLMSENHVPLVISEDVEDEPIIDILGHNSEYDLIIIPFKHTNDGKICSRSKREELVNK
mmetsp:Transcript_41741/g.50014  ORF Transcript_41741/g.50014 Transcript_41741/m.50014 type:complete len:164 (+) Transcript_41741:135-626(+)|eukprot:CAMPEP_0194387920 /NCGR_PEP_ID=MMETSP0174-20130528/95237_1 /TAXON_ID=216777 /ORGANISM="Proboscia alata, Strain PI-D3" /LENGTH=163 /DNA_ID=CAMNT_0039178637 /DNA_START=28 /DNA_END=519 /DNA_ORIENTATION=-